MTKAPRILVAVAALTVLAGCSTINNLTGQTDNTVLPGQREDAIPGRSQFPERNDVETASTSPGTPAEQDVQQRPIDQDAGSTAQAKCQPGDPGCEPASGDDVFSDPQ